jgi:hypothetical protein
VDDVLDRLYVAYSKLESITLHGGRIEKLFYKRKFRWFFNCAILKMKSCGRRGKAKFRECKFGLLELWALIVDIRNICAAT